MKTPELALVYVLLGLGFTAAWAFRRRAETEVADLALLLVFWPLYGPFLLTSRRPSPLASLMPDPALLADLGQRLELAKTRVQAIDVLLSDPAMPAAQGLRPKLETIRERFQRELALGEDLLAQLRLREQAVRLAGPDDPGRQGPGSTG
jgi:hypothetical protein